jgi:hypothetical protein
MRRHQVTNILGGFAGGLAGSFVMERLQRALGRVSPEIGGAPGGGGQQYRQPQSEPSTYKAADLVATAATGHPVPPSRKPMAGAAVHYAFGGAVGAIYGAAAARNSEVTSGWGLPFGASVWLIADELGMPALGLALPPSAHPAKDHATTFASHLLFGAVTECVRRSVVATLGR